MIVQTRCCQLVVILSWGFVEDYQVQQNCAPDQPSAQQSERALRPAGPLASTRRPL